MKKLNVMMALVAMTAGASFVQAEENAACGTKKQEVTASKASAEEQFAGKLNEQNRKAFDQFSVEQKKSAMAAAVAAGANKVALNPNDAVQKVLKEQNVTSAEKADVKAAAPAAAPAKAK